MGEGASFALGPPRPPPHGRGHLLRFGTTEAPIGWARGPPSLWDHQGPHRMGEGASFALGPPRPPPHGRGGLLRFGTTEAPPRHGRGGLLNFGTTEAPAAWAKGSPSLWDHQGPHHVGEGASFFLGPLSPPPPRMGEGAFFALGSPRPPPHGRGGLFRFGITEAPTA